MTTALTREEQLARMREYHFVNKERVQKRTKAFYIENRARILSERRAMYSPKLNREANLKNKYGLTLEAYMELYNAQEGRCAMCRISAPSFGRKGLVVDHNHQTGQLRGLLCLRCNIALGWFETSDFNLIQRYLDVYDRD